MILVRPRAWWFNKVPLSLTLLLLLVDGRPASPSVAAAIALVVSTVCAVGNYGYALNDLFDMDEDARLGRDNAAQSRGSRLMWPIIGLSALCAEICATMAASLRGAILTPIELSLSLLYSVPPFRIKERKWLGVAADALAAHVYPAALALLTVTQWSIRPAGIALTACTLVWSSAAGVRGILSHQLHTAHQDRSAGLETVVHELGRTRLERFIVGFLLPLEVVGFAGILAFCDAGVALWIGLALYLGYEITKTIGGRLRVTAFRPEGQRYLPFLEESFYKGWGPIVVSIDAARIDPAYLLIIPVYALLFRPHLSAEFQRLRAMVEPVR